MAAPAAVVAAVAHLSASSSRHRERAALPALGADVAVSVAGAKNLILAIPGVGEVLVPRYDGAAPAAAGGGGGGGDGARGGGGGGVCCGARVSVGMPFISARACSSAS